MTNIQISREQARQIALDIYDVLIRDIWAQEEEEKITKTEGGTVA